MRNEAYEDIMSLRGFDEFKALAGRLSQLAANRRSLPEANIRVPNFLFVEAPGAGVTTQIRLLTRLLQTGHDVIRADFTVGSERFRDGLKHPLPQFRVRCHIAQLLQDGVLRLYVISAAHVITFSFM